MANENEKIECNGADIKFRLNADDGRVYILYPLNKSIGLKGSLYAGRLTENGLACLREAVRKGENIAIKFDKDKLELREGIEEALRRVDQGLPFTF